MRKHAYTIALALLTMLPVLFVSNRAEAAENSGQSAAEQRAASILGDIGKATWIEEGKSPHVVYIFFDPNCPYCHRVYLDTRSAVKSGKVQIRWIPVGVLTTTSAGKAAAMLEAKDPLAAFYKNENHYERGSGGAIEEALLGSDKTEQALNTNAALLNRTGAGAVPTLLFETDTGKALVIQGAPPADKLAFILQHVK